METARSVKFLWENKDLSLAPSEKASAEVGPCNPRAARQRQEDPGACWPASLAPSVSSVFTETPWHKSKVKSN